MHLKKSERTYGFFIATFCVLFVSHLFRSFGFIFSFSRASRSLARPFSDRPLSHFGAAVIEHVALAARWARRALASCALPRRAHLTDRDVGDCLRDKVKIQRRRRRNCTFSLLQQRWTYSRLLSVC